MLLFSLITSKTFQTANWCECNFVGEVMTDVISTKENIHFTTLFVSKRM